MPSQRHLHQLPIAYVSHVQQAHLSHQRVNNSAKTIPYAFLARNKQAYQQAHPIDSAHLAKWGITTTLAVTGRVKVTPSALLVKVNRVRPRRPQTGCAGQ